MVDITLPLEPANLIEPGHRQFFCIQGEQAACRSKAERLLEQHDPIWVSNLQVEKSTWVPMGQVNGLLGQETTSLVFDAHDGFNPDAFAAASGLVVGGGVLMLLIPPMDDWVAGVDPEAKRLGVHGYDLESQPNRFIRRLARDLPKSATMIDAHDDLVPLISCPPWKTKGTKEQGQAIAAVERVSTGHRRRPLVLTADRGRGKSAAFGMAAASLLQQGKINILVTAPRLDAVHTLFKHAAQLLPLARHSKGLIELEAQQIRFVAPDALIIERPSADLLLVDEAAGIPLPLLQSLVMRYSRVAFATTIHGYEGTGRGFVLRFNQMLDDVAPQWRKLHLTRPVRWSAGDPVEAFGFKALLMDAEPAAGEDMASSKVEEFTLEHLDRDSLIQNETLLRELFGLLITAHYRTTPFDLRHLLDGPNISIWIVRHAGSISAAILAAREGGFDQDTSREIWLGKRRPHGHLVPEALAAQVGIEQAPCFEYLRIIRIAVHPDLQGRGIGSAMLDQLVQAMEKTAVDVLGVSYGASARLLRFWRRAGFSAVRIGLTRDASSGAHSALMIRGISEAGRVLQSEANEKFYARYPTQLSEPLQDLEAELAVALLARQKFNCLPDMNELKAFALGARHYGDCVLSLRQLVFHLAESGFARISTEESELLVTKVLQGRSWQFVAGMHGLSGRRQVIERLRAVVSNCLA